MARFGRVVLCGRKGSSTQEPRAAAAAAARTEGFRVDQRPPCLLNLALALQHVLVQSSLLVLVCGVLQQQLQDGERERKEGEREKLLASMFFFSGFSTLLQTWLGSCLPLVQAPSLQFLVAALVLLGTHSGSEAACRGQCVGMEEAVAQASPVRELQGMTVTAGVVQLAVGVSGLSGAVLQCCGPLVLAPLLCVLGFSVYREAALLCSDHWGFAALAVVLIVLLSQHLRSCVPPACLRLPHYPVCKMLSVLLAMLSVWGGCSALEHWGYVRLHSVSELLPVLPPPNTSRTLQGNTDAPFRVPVPGPNLNSSSILAPWLSLPLTAELGLPLLSGRAIAAGVAAALSCSISSQAVYFLVGRLVGAPAPPAQACARGLCAEGLGSVAAGLLGAPMGVCSSVPNACTLGLNQCGSRGSAQLAAAVGLVLGVSPRLTQLLTSVPLAVYGAVLSVTYAIAVATGVTYFQYAHMDSGRNMFNIGFTVFLALVLPRWFSQQAGLISTGTSSLDVLLQSLLTLPVFLVGLFAFLLDNTVPGSLSERGLDSSRSTKPGVWSVTDRRPEYLGELGAVYDPPHPVRRLLALPGLRVVPFCACRTLDREDVTVPSQEMSSLLSGEELRMKGEETVMP